MFFLWQIPHKKNSKMAENGIISLLFLAAIIHFLFYWGRTAREVGLSCQSGQSKAGRSASSVSTRQSVSHQPPSQTSASSLNPGVFSPLNCENEVKCSGWVARHTVNKLTDQGQVAAAAASGSELEGTSDKKEPAIWFELFPTSFYGSDFLLMNCIAWQDGGFHNFCFFFGFIGKRTISSPSMICITWLTFCF